MKARLRIAYIIEEPQFCGGVKVVFQHARLLVAAGHFVSVYGRGDYPTWALFGGHYVNYATGCLNDYTHGEFYDLVIATYYPTIESSLAANMGPVVHFCQGYEGDLEHLHAQVTEIERVYRIPLPSFVVSPHLGYLLQRRFDRPFVTVPPPKDLHFFPSIRMAPRRSPTIIVPGIFEAPCKGVKQALEAVCRLKRVFPKLRLVRFSTLPESEAERAILSADSYLCGVSPQVVSRILRQADLMIFPSTATEGFGLPLLESMSCKLPAVASRIPSVEYMCEDALPMVQSGDVEAYAWEAEKLLTHADRWLVVRRRMFSQSRRFHPRRVAKYLSDALDWVRGSERKDRLR